MKLSNILSLILLLGMGSMIFAIKHMQKSNDPEPVTAVPSVPVPVLKPEFKTTHKSEPKTILPILRLELSTPEKAGSYDRLSLNKFLSKGSPNIGIRDIAPKSNVQKEPIVNSVIKPPHKNKGDQAVINHPPSIQSANLKIDTADAINLPYLPQINENRFVDRVVDIAETSPIQPDVRGCGTLKSNLNTAPIHAKVRSVGMERQITKRTSIGVEYVYKDGCYKNAIAPLKSFDMPGDDGVNLRVNMTF